MIWNSPFLMATFDVAIISAAVFSLVTFTQHRQTIRRLHAGAGVAWLIFGLVTLAVFYSIDLFTTGYAERAAVHHGRLGKDDAVIEKPYRKAALARKLRISLGNEEG